jgi:HEAT repeat protein
LSSRSEAVQDGARDALDHVDAAPALLRGWRSSDASQRVSALRHAVALKHPGLMEIYREARRDAEPDVRRNAAIGLKRQPPTGEVHELLAALAADPDRDVRWWAIDSLRAIGSYQSRAILESRRETEDDAGLRPFIERALSAGA